MPNLRVHNLVVSLDGYATGEGQSLDAAFGHAQQEFMEWFGKLRIWRGLLPDGKLGADEARYSIETVTVPSGATHLFFTR